MYRIFQATASYRYTERLLREGDALSVVGEMRASSSIGSVEGSARELLHEWKQDQAALLSKFDRNQDGRIDAEEWELTREEAAKQSQSQTLKTDIVRTSVIGQPTHGEPFLIAAMDSAHLVQRERLRAIAYLGLGLASVALCACVAITL
jgi:hypothetical protein